MNYFSLFFIIIFTTEIYCESQYHSAHPGAKRCNMVKLVTVLERQVCIECKGAGVLADGQTCNNCNGSGTIEVEVMR